MKKSFWQNNKKTIIVSVSTLLIGIASSQAKSWYDWKSDTDKAITSLQVESKNSSETSKEVKQKVDRIYEILIDMNQKKN